MWKKAAVVVFVVIILICLVLLTREKYDNKHKYNGGKQTCGFGRVSADLSDLKRMLIRVHKSNNKMLCSKSYVALVDDIIDRLKDQVCILKLRELKQEVDASVPDKDMVLNSILKYLDYLEMYCERMPHKKMIVKPELNMLIRNWIDKSAHNTSVCATNLDEYKGNDSLTHERREVYEGSYLENIVNS
jgi:hypothetical protein